jgi:hypothetical protein
MASRPDFGGARAVRDSKDRTGADVRYGRVVRVHHWYPRAGEFD